MNGFLTLPQNMFLVDLKNEGVSCSEVEEQLTLNSRDGGIPGPNGGLLGKASRLCSQNSHVIIKPPYKDIHYKAKH